MRVTLSETGLERAIELIDQMPGRASRAVVRALNEAGRWGNTQLRRAIAAQAQVPQRLIRDRVRLRRAARNNMRVNLWAGVSPLPAVLLGTPVQGAVGTRVGRRMFPHAFVATIYGRQTIWRRRRATRFPVEEVTVEIDPGESTVRSIADGMSSRFASAAERLIALELERLP